MQIMKKTVALLLVVTLLCGLTAGCATLSGEEDTRPVVTVQALSTCEDMLKAIEEQCPDIQIKWYLSSQVHENAYIGMDDTPDILIRQAYYIDESVNAGTYLKDVSEFEVTGKYSKTLIDSFKDESGALYWLPIQGTGMVFVANNALFEQYGVELPHDYESLLAADQAFKAQGLDGVSWPLSENYAYSGMQLVMALSADLLNSVDGVQWKNTYASEESGAEYTLDDSVWPEIFNRLEQAFSVGLIDEKDLETSAVDAVNRMQDGEAAISLINTANLTVLDMENYTALPMFDMEGNSWLPLYMNLRVGINKNVTEDRMDDVLQVLEAYISTTTFNAYQQSRGGVIPMNNDASDLPEELAGLREVVAGGYTFLQMQDQNGGLINGLNATIHIMAAENLDGAGAYALCKEKILENRKDSVTGGLNDEDPSAVFFTSDAAYSLTTDDNHNNPAGSAIVNTLLDVYNAYGEDQFDILLMEGNVAGAPIRKIAYYTDADGSVGSFTGNFYYLLNASRQVYSATMTVEELIQYINTSFYYFHRIDDGLAIMAGASYKVEKYPEGLTDEELPFTPNNANAGDVANRENYPTCYVCTGIVKDGKELPLDTTLRVAVGRVEMFYITERDSTLDCEWVGFDGTVTIPDAEGKGIGQKDLLKQWLSEGHQFTAPTQYVTITEAKTASK